MLTFIVCIWSLHICNMNINIPFLNPILVAGGRSTPPLLMKSLNALFWVKIWDQMVPAIHFTLELRVPVAGKKSLFVENHNIKSQQTALLITEQYCESEQKTWPKYWKKCSQFHGRCWTRPTIGLCTMSNIIMNKAILIKKTLKSNHTTMSFLNLISKKYSTLK